jgi:hypothetical protein
MKRQKSTHLKVTRRINKKKRYRTAALMSVLLLSTIENVGTPVVLRGVTWCYVVLSNVGVIAPQKTLQNTIKKEGGVFF